MPLLIDIHEPKLIVDLLKQSIPDVYVTSLNTDMKADYYWMGVDGHTIQIERKQWGELVGEFDRIEEIIRKYMDNSDEMYLLMEGVARPTQIGVEALEIYGKKIVKSHIFKRRYSEVMSWLWQLDKSGITVFNTFDEASTAIAISAFYKNSMKLEHTTLQRYIKHKNQAWHPNPHVQNLIDVFGANIGPVRAEAAVRAFGTYWNVINQNIDSLSCVEGWGSKTAEQLLRAIGRIK